MHILVVNDDGPPSPVSPYFHPFLDALHAAGHTTVVVIPDSPLSWIGKAHAVGKTLTATSVCPQTFAGEQTSCTATCRASHWLLLDGPPASCTQIGLYHTGHSPSSFDLVVSGPNHGPNASTIYNLSSGTVGGALEGALCGKKSIALSFGSKLAQPEDLIDAACRCAVGLVERLHAEWHDGVELYNVNVPMVPDVERRPVEWTRPATAYWSKSSLFREMGGGEDGCSNADDGVNAVEQGRRVFRWAPELSDVKSRTETSKVGEDLWALKNGFVSVTAFKANFTGVLVD